MAQDVLPPFSVSHRPDITRSKDKYSPKSLHVRTQLLGRSFHDGCKVAHDPVPHALIFYEVHPFYYLLVLLKVNAELVLVHILYLKSGFLDVFRSYVTHYSDLLLTLIFRVLIALQNLNTYEKRDYCKVAYRIICLC